MDKIIIIFHQPHHTITLLHYCINLLLAFIYLFTLYSHLSQDKRK